MSQKTKNERLTEEMPGTSITNIQNDLEKKECEDIGKEKKHKFINLFGKIFSRLEVLEYSHTDNYGQRIWKCICNCGNLTYVSTNKLNNHHTQSCGCLHKEKLRLSVLKHGLSRTLGYRVWIAMMQRCYDKKHPNYKNYGSRGISVCKKWHKFENFLQDMGQPKVGKELDRINNNGDYNFENCRWTDGITQGNNTRRNRYLEYNGRKQTIAQWARELNISPNKIIKRIDYQNWSIERTLNTK